MPADLRELQRRFFELVTAPEDVPATLAKRQLPVESLHEILRGDEKLSPAARLDIYANMYFFRIRDVLRDDYEKVVKLVGDEAFHNLVTDYLVAHPPRHFSLRNAGRALPEFLRAHPLAEHRPYLADLARLERERIEVFDAADCATLDMESLRTRAPETFASLELQLIPACTTIAAEFAVDEAWQALDEDREPPALSRAPSTFAVWRNEPMTYHRALGPDEAALWPLLAGGVSFGIVCDRLTERHADEDVAPLAFQLLATWVNEGLLRAEEEEGEG
jgi:hypothetical protein